ncbi:MAG: hypothetical protein EZS28_054817, partial [Streblomastix strix]
MQFEGCESEIGGGLSMQCKYAGQVIINEMSFSNCNCTNDGGGGGFYSSLDLEAQMTITGKIRVDNCHGNNSGGGQYLYVNGYGSIVNITGELEYKQCQSDSGGGLYANILNWAIVEINKASFTDCSCKKYGGGIFVNNSGTGQFIVSGLASILNCNSSLFGGGIYLEIYDSIVNFKPTEQILIENSTCDGSGGGIYCKIEKQGQI